MECLIQTIEVGRYAGQLCHCIGISSRALWWSCNVEEPEVSADACDPT
jgi:hypothetical protein